MMEDLARWFPLRHFALCADGFYALLAGKNLPRTHITSRLRRDATLFAPLSPTRRRKSRRISHAAQTNRRRSVRPGGYDRFDPGDRRCAQMCHNVAHCVQRRALRRRNLNTLAPIVSHHGAPLFAGVSSAWMCTTLYPPLSAVTFPK